MEKQEQRVFAYLFIAAGTALSFVSAVVPHYGAGYRLMAGVLFAGLLPYLAYGAAVPFLRGRLLTLSGAIVVALHAALVLRERFLGQADYGNGLIYLVPLILALAMTPLIVKALHQPWGIEPAGTPPEPVEPGKPRAEDEANIASGV